MEHDPPVLIEYYAIDEESTKTVVCIRDATTDGMHLVNGQKYLCGDDLSQEHLKGCWACTQIFSRDNLAEKTLTWVEAWQSFESEGLVRCRGRARPSLEGRGAVAYWRHCI